jgi:cell division septal protein FtsQ
MDLSGVLGQNIFSLDLNRQAQDLADRFTCYKEIRLLRLLPDAVIIDAAFRLPLGRIKLPQDFYVDEEGVLFNLGKGQTAVNVPYIVGLKNRLRRPEAGRKYDIREMNLVIDLITNLRKDSLLKNYTVEKIDAARPSSLSFLLKRGPEIRIGNTQIPAKLDVLHSLFGHIKTKWLRIKYIDLRFREPVIRFK